MPRGPIRRGVLSLRIDRAPLMHGAYSLDLYFGSHRMAIDTVHDACRFEVHPADVFGSGRLPQPSAGSVFWPGAWELSLDEGSDHAVSSAPARNGRAS
jgi:hypothetical protein